jgi:hypothetical protein
LSLFPDDREIPADAIDSLQVKLSGLELRCYTQPSPDTKMLIEKLKFQLPSQPPPRLVAQKESYEIEVPTVP